MAHNIEFHTRMVRWMKIILPLLALGLLSTIFLLSRTIDPSQSIPFTKLKLEQIAQTTGASKPNFTGMTGDGGEIYVEADSINSDAILTGVYHGVNVVGQIETAAGAVIDVTSDQGRMNENEQMAHLIGNVVIISTDGYDFRTEVLHSRIDRIEGESDGPVYGISPFGTLDAGKMKFDSTTTGGNIKLYFSKGVTVVYKEEETED